MDCIFCKIVEGEIPCEKVVETERALAFLDLYPVNKGHVLVVPKRHYFRLDEIDSATLHEMADVAQRIAAAQVHALSAEGYNLVMNNGEVAGQEILHAHMHIIPRFSNDQMRFGWRHMEYGKDELGEYGRRLRESL